jgi:hypothetical protein
MSGSPYSKTTLPPNGQLLRYREANDKEKVLTASYINVGDLMAEQVVFPTAGVHSFVYRLSSLLPGLQA